MDPGDLAFAGIARQAELIRAGEVSSRELVELYLGRIERIDPALNSYRVVLAERALEEADQADARRGSGDERPLPRRRLAAVARRDARAPVQRGLPAHVDSTVLCEAPKLAPRRDAMRAALARRLGLEPEAVNVKFTTGEGMGFVGRGEGVAALAIATLEQRG